MITTYKGVSIYYSEIGQGPTVVLIHGFLENSSMWDSFLPILSKTHHVITIDLLGHGNSGNIGYIHTMKDMATAVHFVLDHLNLAQVTLIGHSMGGYVGCAFAKAYPEKTTALCLLNSTPLADNSERKAIRARANIMAQENYTQLVRMSFTNLFDSTTRENHKVAIKEGLKAALNTSVQGYIAGNSGMKSREDYTSFWKESTIKKAMILGEDDWIVESTQNRNLFQEHTDFFKIIPGGHMSHIGQQDATLGHLLGFLSIL